MARNARNIKDISKLLSSMDLDCTLLVIDMMLGFSF